MNTERSFKILVSILHFGILREGRTINCDSQEGPEPSIYATMVSITGNLIFQDQLWQSRTSYSAAIIWSGLFMAAIIGPLLDSKLLRLCYAWYYSI